MKTNTNELIEMISLRLNSYGDTHIFQEILNDLSDVFRQPGYPFRSARLYKSSQVDNDWAIYLRSPSAETGVKSSLAISLAEALRTVGLVHHTVWMPCDTSELNKIYPRKPRK